jgi:hypothetical protein
MWTLRRMSKAESAKVFTKMSAPLHDIPVRPYPNRLSG